MHALSCRKQNINDGSLHANGALMPDFDGNNWRNVTVPFDLGTNSFLQGYADSARMQEVTAPSTGIYTLTFYSTADRDGGIVGANVNGALAVSSPVEARGFRNYGAPYTMTFPATAGDTIRLWMYSPAIPGYVAVDDVSLIGPQ